MLNLYTRLIEYFNGPIQVSAPQENIATEKATDLNNSIAWVSDGKFTRLVLSKINKAYSTNYAIHKCINILANNLAKLPLRVYRNDEPMPLDFKLNGGFDILQPHPRMSLSQLLYECGVYYWYKGEFMSKIDLETPFSLEPIDPELMMIATKDTNGNILTWRFDNRLIIPSDQLIYTNMLNPDAATLRTKTDFNRTLKPINVVESEILNYASGREFNTQFFKNYAQLGLTLKDLNGATTIEDRKEIVRAIDNSIEAGNAWRSRCLPQGLDVADTKNLSMREMEFGQSLKDIRDIILGVFGVSRSVFGITNESGLAQNTVDVEKRIMWTETIQPIAYRIQEAFNNTLMKRYFPGYKVYFDYSDIDVLQGNLLDKTVLAKNYRELGYTTNEINEVLDLGMEDNTDPVLNERFIPSNLVPYSEISLPAEEENTKSVDKLDEIVKILNIEETKSKRSTNYARRFNRAQREVEKKMASKLGGYFAKQLGKVLATIKEEKSVTKTNSTLLLSAIMNLLNEEKETLSKIMGPLYTEGALKGSGLALETLNVTTSPRADEAIVASLTNKIRSINNHTYRLIRTQVKDGINAGETIDQIADRIKSVYKFNSSRARTIARTESGSVMSRSTDKEYREKGVEKKQWLGGTRPTHVAINGQIKNYNEPFDNGLMYPHDPSGPAGETINCTCCLAPVVE